MGSQIFQIMDIMVREKEKKEYCLIYNRPATNWNEALPLGNGSIGAMFYGQLEREQIDLNADTLWAGHQEKQTSNNSYKYLPEVRSALKKNDYKTADSFYRKMQGDFSKSYLPLGSLLVQSQIDKCTNFYRRSLNITKSVGKTSFISDSDYFERELFISKKDNVLVFQIISTNINGFSCRINFETQLKSSRNIIIDNILIYSGNAPYNVFPNYYNEIDEPIQWTNENGQPGMAYAVGIATRHEGGSISVDEDCISVKNVKKFYLLLNVATGYKSYDLIPEVNPDKLVCKLLNTLSNAQEYTYDELKKRHITDYSGLFDRLSLKLGNSIHQQLSTDERLIRYSKGINDPEFVELVFQYSRYLMISSSREGSEAANLQGIWSNLIRPPWSSNYTVNINIQMIYWIADVANLSECHIPLFKLIEKMSILGKNTAKNIFNSKGWCCCHNSDIWGHTDPSGYFGYGDPVWANWPLAGVWLCLHLWDHYEFTLDRDFLISFSWPIMKSSAEFCLDWILENENTGYLYTSPSTSPENYFIATDGTVQSLCQGSQVDLSVIEEHFSNCESAINCLDLIEEERELLLDINSALMKFPKPKIDRFGQIAEWDKDFIEFDPEHRHHSHLLSFHPGKLWSPSRRPELQKAIEKTLRKKGNKGTGWSCAWKISNWARLKNKNEAFNSLQYFLTPCAPDARISLSGGGLYPNLLDAHPPFQIDGNFGVTAGICEMLIQSHDNCIELLPTLPSQWSTGFIKGIKARHKLEFDIFWDDCKLIETSILSPYDLSVTLVYNTIKKTIYMPSGKIIQLNGKLEYLESLLII